MREQCKQSLRVYKDDYCHCAVCFRGGPRVCDCGHTSYWHSSKGAWSVALKAKPQAPKLITRAVSKKINEVRGYCWRVPVFVQATETKKKRYVTPRAYPYGWSNRSLIVRRDKPKAKQVVEARELKRRPKKRSKPWAYSRGMDRRELEDHIDEYLGEE